MRRAFLTSAIVIGGLFAAGCSDQRAPLPTQPPASADVTTQCPSAKQIDAQITALFPPKDLLASARDMWNNVKVKVRNNDVAGAQKKALMLIDFTLKNYYRGKLLDPNGSDPPTTQQAVVELIDGVLCFVGLPASGLTLGPTGAPVTTTVIGSSGGALKASDGLSALKVDPGTVSEDRLWVITRRDDLAQAGTCVTTKLQQIPLCMDFSVGGWHISSRTIRSSSWPRSATRSRWSAPAPRTCHRRGWEASAGRCGDSVRSWLDC